MPTDMPVQVESGVRTVHVDVADIEATRKEVEKLCPIHMLVNNAGVTQLQPFLEVTPEAYDTLAGLLQGGGSIIGVGRGRPCSYSACS